MNPATVIGHQNVLDRFACWLNQGRLANTYLLAGPEGIGKRLVAMHLAKALLCESTGPDDLESCGQCSACHQVDAETHPDLLIVQRPPEKNLIPVELLIGSRDQRMRAGLCHDIALKPFRGGRRIAILDDADFLNPEGANCLLKTLEEPPAFAVIFLISGSEHRQLPTIRSRSQIVRFHPLLPAEIENILIGKGLLEDNSMARELALACAGRPSLALELSEPATFSFRRAWIEKLASLDPGSEGFAENINSFVDSAGKDNATRRNRLRSVAEMAAWFYRNVMVALCDQDTPADDWMNSCVNSAVGRWPADAEVAAACVDRCNCVGEQVASNANQALVIETLLSDLGRIVRREVLV